MQPEQAPLPPPTQLSPVTQPPKKPFWRRLGVRFVLGMGVPLLVLAGVLGFAYVQDRGSDTRNNTPPQSQSQQDQLAQQQSIDTPNGRRYASIDTIAELDNTKTLAEAHAALQRFLDQYELQLHTTSVQPSEYVQEHDSFDVLAEQDLSAFRDYAKVFVDEWAKYPRDWIQESNVKHVVLIKNLAVSDTERAATPDPVGDALYYDIGYGAGLYAREVIHHEFNHQIEYEHFNSYARTDAPWSSLNPEGFAYNPQGGVAAYHEDDFENDSHPGSGFVNRYAMYGIEEDKAEVYAYLMTREYYYDLREWVKTDDKLARKVQLYKEFIRSVSPEMDDDYFAAINP